MNPSISIIIPCYNMGSFLQETLNSVISYHNKSDYELIIVNDGSDDASTIALLSKLEKEGYFVLHQENQGLAKARNNGIKLAKGDYILPLDADNKIRHEHLSKSIELFKKNANIDIIYGNKQHFDQDNELVVVNDYDFPLLCEKNYIDACACYRKTLWNKLGGYDENMPIMGYEDWDFWLRASLLGANFHHVNEVLFDYRVRNDSMINNTNQKYSEIVNYIFSKKELSVINSVKTLHQKSRELYFLKKSKEYKLGKLILKPFRLFQK